jgi:Trk K+ transport system NAD-binding subunit
MKVIIIGCGRVGSGLTQVMGRRGHDVTVIDKDPVSLERLGPAFKGRKILGIGFDRDILLEAGILRADALAAVTVSDEANVVSARLARQVFLPRVAATPTPCKPRFTLLACRYLTGCLGVTAWLRCCLHPPGTPVSLQLR